MNDIELLINQIQRSVDGEVLSRSRVLDALLDLRLAAGDRSDLTELIDGSLADLPGKTMVPGDWWRERLAMLELAASNNAEPVG